MSRSNVLVGEITQLLILQRDYQDSQTSGIRARILETILNREFVDVDLVRQSLIEIATDSKSPLEVADTAYALALVVATDLRDEVVACCLDRAIPPASQESLPGLFLGALEVANQYPSAQGAFENGWKRLLKKNWLKRGVVTSQLSGRLSQALAGYFNSVWQESEPKRLKFAFDLIQDVDVGGQVSKGRHNFQQHLMNEVMSKVFHAAPVEIKKITMIGGESDLRHRGLLAG